MASKWKKITGGNILLKKGGRRIKYKEVITATEKELGNHIHHFEKVDEKKRKESKPATEQKPAVNEGGPGIDSDQMYTIEPTGKGWYNVVSQTGEIMNEKGLKKEDAEELSQSLNEEN